MKLYICAAIVVVCIVGANAGGYSGGYGGGHGGGYGGHWGGGGGTVVIPYRYPVPVAVRTGRGGGARVIPATIIRQGGAVNNGGFGGAFGGLISFIRKFSYL